jgi:hypothetical protein
MKRMETVAATKQWPDDVLELCSQDAFYFVPFRVFIILYNVGKLQSSSVPFIHRMWFLPLILGYVCWKRAGGIVTRSAPTLSGHVFCCSSGSAYRTKALFELLDYFSSNGDETTMFTVSEAEVSPLSVASNVRSLWNISEEMAQLLEVESLRYRIIAFNFLIVEFIKYRSIENTAGKIDSFHTFAPMPYQVKAVSHESMCAYQHGIENDDGSRAMAIPQYAPITYFVWGDLWTNRFKKKAHPKSSIYPVGSPRYDTLVEKRGMRTRSIDLLFISGAHTLSREGADEAAYRDLVEMVVDICEQQGWELIIKLHPIEGPERYEQWGYDEYITEETDIEALLLQSDIAVTDLSSAFVESISLGTPIVVTQSSATMDLEPLYGVSGLAFPDSLVEARADIKRLKGSHVTVDSVTESGMMNLNGSCGRIHDITVGNCT